jgi:hypothetical protein
VQKFCAAQGAPDRFLRADGAGLEERRDDGIPGITNGTFAETAARGSISAGSI